MKRTIRVFSLLLCFALMLQSLAFAAAEMPSTWAQNEVNAAISEGLVPAELQKNYTQPISRGAVAQMFVNLLEKSSGKTSAELLAERGAAIKQDAFTDTTDEAVLVCNALGLINGVGGGRFDPEGTLTRAQIAAIMNRAADVLGFSTENYPHSFTDTKGSWVDSELGWVRHVGIISGVGNNQFDPDGKLTTEQAIVITHRALNATTETVWRKVKETRTTQNNGNVTGATVFTWVYDEHGNNVKAAREDKSVSSELSSGWEVTLTYNPYGDVTAQRGILGGFVSYEYSYTYLADGRIDSKTTKPIEADGGHMFGEGGTEYYKYDAQGRLISIDDIDYEYDSAGRITFDGRFAYEYDSSGRLIKKQDESGYQVETYTYEGDRLVSIIEKFGDSLTETRTYSNFDSFGNPGHEVYESKYESEDYSSTYGYESDYEYEPVKKASLPLRWAGADDSIYSDTIG